MERNLSRFFELKTLHSNNEKHKEYMAGPPSSVIVS
jgi:hypothetical protein